MLNANHPDDERLSALAGGDPDEGADAGLTAHVASCDRCAELVRDLGALRMSLGDLPDVAPPRPLRLVPPVPDASAPEDGIGTWMRRLFAPALTAGAALAMVGLVGTASPGTLPTSLDEVGFGGGDAGVMHEADEAAPGDQRLTDTDEPGAVQGEAAGEGDGAAGYGAAAGDDEAPAAEPLSGGRDSDTSEDDYAVPESRAGTTSLPAERSPWPMVLFTGVAVIVGALLLRWILVPRAG